MRYVDYEAHITHLIELPGVYDGWSVAVLDDGRKINRWANEGDDGPREGYEWRYTKTQEWLATD